MHLLRLSQERAAREKRISFILTVFGDLSSSLFTVLEECYYVTEENTRIPLPHLKPSAKRATSPV